MGLTPSACALSSFPNKQKCMGASIRCGGNIVDLVVTQLCFQISLQKYQKEF